MSARLETEEILRRLVAFDTASSRSNGPLVDFVRDYLDAPGTLVETTEHERKINLAVRRGPERDDRAGLVLCGHSDTVPADEPGWTGDPWTLRETDDRWYGRGACDMKGFLALAMTAFERRDAGALGAPLALVFTCDEEVGSLGAQRFVEAPERLARLPRSVLIGEPTGLAAIRLHKGHLRGSILFRGVAAHSGYPHRGVNAIDAAARSLVALADLQRELERHPPAAAARFAPVPFEVLNAGAIRGGGPVNVIPDRCRVDFGIRLLPGSDPDRLVAEMERTIVALDLACEWEITVHNVSPALETPAEAPLYRELVASLAQAGSPAVAFSSDAGVLSRHGFDCVLFGPGSIEVAHKPDEYLPKAELARAAAVVEGLVDRFCGAQR
jgi:acetylornithine deacetylase